MFARRPAARPPSRPRGSTTAIRANRRRSSSCSTAAAAPSPPGSDVSRHDSRFVYRDPCRLRRRRPAGAGRKTYERSSCLRQATDKKSRSCASVWRMPTAWRSKPSWRVSHPRFPDGKAGGSSLRRRGPAGRRGWTCRLSTSIAARQHSMEHATRHVGHQGWHADGGHGNGPASPPSTMQVGPRNVIVLGVGETLEPTDSATNYTGLVGVLQNFAGRRA